MLAMPTRHVAAFAKIGSLDEGGSAAFFFRSLNLFSKGKIAWINIEQVFYHGWI
jgi:hypothetical protein